MVSLCDFAIVGSGLAGLVVANNLISRGYTVKIIEAENQIGGKVVSYRLRDEEGTVTHFECGPFSFGDKEFPLCEYIQRFALPIIEQTPIEKKFCFQGQRGVVDEKGTFLKGEEAEIPLSQLLSYYREKLEKITDDMSLKDALQLVGASSEAIEWLKSNTLPGLLGNGSLTISMKAALAFLKQYDSSTSSCAIRGGNDQIAQALAKGLENSILLNHRVKKIEQLKEKCILSGELFTIEAKRTIIATSLPQMKSIEIDPPLSLRKREVIQNVFYTTTARISIVAPPAIFDSPPRGGVFFLSDRLGWFRDQTIFQIDPYKKTVLNVSLAGELAEKVLATSASFEEWKIAIDKALSELYPKWDPKQATYYTSVCKEAYSSFAPNTYEEQESLRAFEGRIHFAGEYSSPQYATMNGAIESGERLAKEIFNSEK
jgi:monoamine oxidase